MILSTPQLLGIINGKLQSTLTANNPSHLLGFFGFIVGCNWLLLTSQDVPTLEFVLYDQSSHAQGHAIEKRSVKAHWYWTEKVDVTFDHDIYLHIHTACHIAALLKNSPKVVQYFARS